MGKTFKRKRDDWDDDYTDTFYKVDKEKARRQKRKQKELSAWYEQADEPDTYDDLPNTYR